MIIYGNLSKKIYFLISETRVVENVWKGSFLLLMVDRLFNPIVIQDKPCRIGM